MLLRALLNLACDEPWQPEQVVSGAAEDEDPVDPSQLYLSEWAALLQPAEGHQQGGIALSVSVGTGRFNQKADCILVSVNPCGRSRIARRTGIADVGPESVLTVAPGRTPVPA